MKRQIEEAFTFNEALVISFITGVALGGFIVAMAMCYFLC